MTIALNTIKKPAHAALILKDRVVGLMLLLLFTLSMIDGNQAVESLFFTGKALFHISPFFLLAILFAAYAKASGADQLIARAFSGKTAVAIIAGSLAGIKKER